MNIIEEIIAWIEGLFGHAASPTAAPAMMAPASATTYTGSANSPSYVTGASGNGPLRTANIPGTTGTDANGFAVPIGPSGSFIPQAGAPGQYGPGGPIPSTNSAPLSVSGGQATVAGDPRLVPLLNGYPFSSINYDLVPLGTYGGQWARAPGSGPIWVPNGASPVQKPGTTFHPFENSATAAAIGFPNGGYYL